MERKLFDRLPDDTWFYPGHGRDSRTARCIVARGAVNLLRAQRK